MTIIPMVQGGEEDASRDTTRLRSRAATGIGTKQRRKCQNKKMRPLEQQPRSRAQTVSKWKATCFSMKDDSTEKTPRCAARLPPRWSLTLLNIQQHGFFIFQQSLSQPSTSSFPQIVRHTMLANMITNSPLLREGLCVQPSASACKLIPSISSSVSFLQAQVIAFGAVRLLTIFCKRRAYEKVCRWHWTSCDMCPVGEH